MKRCFSCVLALSVCLIAVEASAQDMAADDPAGSATLQDLMTSGFAAMTAGDTTPFHTADPMALLYDINAEGNPIAESGADAWNAYLDSMAQMAQAGATVTNDITAITCHATTDLGYCTLEFTQSVTTPEGTMGPVMVRGTAIWRKAGDTWVPEHWHGSFAAWPEMMMGGEGTAEP